MTKENIDKLKATVDDVVAIIADVQAAKESGGKITALEGLMLGVQHAGKAVRFVTNIQEIGNELKDLDGAETQELAVEIAENFGSTEDAQGAIKDIAFGIGALNQGIQKLIELKKS